METAAAVAVEVKPKTRRYEGLFLVEPSLAAKHWDRVEKELKALFEKNGATIEALQKWGERKLAYPVESQKRGTYILAYFHAAGTQMAGVNSSIGLSEIVLRTLIIEKPKTESEVLPELKDEDELRKEREADRRGFRDDR